VICGRHMVGDGGNGVVRVVAVGKLLAADDWLWPGVLDPSRIAGLPVSASQVCASSDAVRPRLLIA
jgi:hypothetical protein